MLTFLDLIVVVFMVLTAASLMAACLMFLVRNPKLRRICFYVVVALGVYTATVGARIGSFLFPMQTAVAVLGGAASIAALVMERRNKDNERKFLIARILSAAALVVGICNAFLF